MEINKTLDIYDFFKLMKFVQDCGDSKIYEITKKYSYNKELADFHLANMNKKLKEINGILKFIEDNLVD